MIASPRQIEIGTDAAAPGESSNDEIVGRLKRATQELLDAVALGDKAVWQRHLAEGSIYAEEEGKVWMKDELLKESKLLPKGYVGSIKIEETKALVQDNRRENNDFVRRKSK